MAYTRTHIRLEKTREIEDFVRNLNSDGTTDKYVIENFDGTLRADARSLLGVIYMTTDYEDTYLVNLSNNGCLPSFVNKYRV